MVCIASGVISLGLECAGYIPLARPSALWSAGAVSYRLLPFVGDRDVPGVLFMSSVGSGVVPAQLGRGLG
jgi:hypothetical protein